MTIGLGVSSIGDSSGAYAQNVKNIEEYQHLVANSVLPLAKGHLLDHRDQILRRHIIDLMCRFKTHFGSRAAMSEDYGEILENLAEMESDGLVTLGPDELIVTEKGKPHVRNICMAFDLRLQRKKPETQLFSMTV